MKTWGQRGIIFRYYGFVVLCIHVSLSIRNERTYFSDEGLSDVLVLEARVGELIIVIIRWRPVTMVTGATGWCCYKKN